MAQSHSSKILEVCKVAPLPDLTESAAAPKSLPLTFFDISYLRTPPIEQLFFYQVHSLTSKLFLDSIVPKLKHSLSLTLHHYLPLAGNLTWPHDSHKPVLAYVDGDGVSFAVAQSTMDFHHLSNDDFRRQAIQCRPLLPNLSTSHERASAIALRVTVFPNYGFCVGIVYHHAVFDAQTSMLFFKAWAHISKSEADSAATLSLPPELTPYYDRTLINDPDEYEAAFLDAWLNLGGPNNRSLMLREIEVPSSSARGTFELTRNDIEKLRKHVSSSDDGHEYSKGIRFSTFSIACGYAWACLVKASEKQKGKKEMMVYMVDCRTRLNPAMPPTYIGTCLGSGVVFAEADDLVGDHGVVSAVVALSKSISNLDHNNGFLGSKEGWVRYINSSTGSKSSGNGTGPIVVAGSHRFEFYTTDFGWGKPKKVEMTSIDTGRAFSLSESKNGNGGVEMGLVLKMEQMEAFASFFAKGLEDL